MSDAVARAIGSEGDLRWHQTRPAYKSAPLPACHPSPCSSPIHPPFVLVAVAVVDQRRARSAQSQRLDAMSFHLYYGGALVFSIPETALTLLLVILCVLCLAALVATASTAASRGPLHLDTDLDDKDVLAEHGSASRSSISSAVSLKIRSPPRSPTTATFSSSGDPTTMV